MRLQALKELIGKDDQRRAIWIKLMAVPAGTSVEADAQLLHFVDECREKPEDHMCV